MSSQDSSDAKPQFTRKTETESICMFCFSTVRGDQYVHVEEAEDIHADVCLMKPGSLVRYVLL